MTPTERKAMEAGRDALATVRRYCVSEMIWHAVIDVTKPPVASNSLGALVTSAISLINASLQEQGEQEGWLVKPEWRKTERGWIYLYIMDELFGWISRRGAGDGWNVAQSGNRYLKPTFPTLEAAKAALIEAVRPKGGA